MKIIWVQKYRNMGEACSTQGTHCECIEYFSRKPENKRSFLIPDVTGALKYTLYK
jgi:hypothetical protein